MDDWIIVSSRDALPLNRWIHVAATYDGSRLASGITLYADGRKVDTLSELDYSNGGIKTKEPFRIGAGADEDGGLIGGIDEVVVYDRELTGEEASMLAVADNLSEIARIRNHDRTHRAEAQTRAGLRRRIRTCGRAVELGGSQPVATGGRGSHEPSL